VPVHGHEQNDLNPNADSGYSGFPDGFSISNHVFRCKIQVIRKGCKCPKIGMMSGDWSDWDLLRAVCMGATVFAKTFDLSRLRSWVSEEKILHVT